ncbi:MAG TPA: glycosyltransferase [Pyrinomonadaceae bacterium]
MRKKALIVGDLNPYKVLDGGIERLLIDYQTHVFSDYDVYHLIYESNGQVELFHYGVPVPGEITTQQLLKLNSEFVLFFNYDTDHQGDDFIQPLRDRVPSFSFVQKHPVETLSDKFFRGILTFSSERRHKNVLVVGGSFDPKVFKKNRKSEEFIVCVARVTPYKGQLELAGGYKKRIYDKYKLPLYLVGGTNHVDFFPRLHKYIDNVSVHSTIDPKDLGALTNWWNGRQIAAICNRARMFVLASPQETFCIALVEAMACGTTCVVNGDYPGFKARELRPHVYGNIRGKRGNTLDLVEEVLRREIRIDASEWARRYSLTVIKKTVLAFIRERL